MELCGLDSAGSGQKHVPAVIDKLLYHKVCEVSSLAEGF
jgi:hypothetical protein